MRLRSVVVNKKCLLEIRIDLSYVQMISSLWCGRVYVYPEGVVVEDMEVWPDLHVYGVFWVIFIFRYLHFRVRFPNDSYNET